MSSVVGGCGDPKHLVKHTHAYPVHNETRCVANSWMAVDLGAGRLLAAEHYALRKEMQNTYAPRYWGGLQGWVDVGLAWAALRSHQNDQGSPTGPGCKMDVDVAAWPPDASATCAGAPFVISAFFRRVGRERASGAERLLGTGWGSSCTALCRLSSRWQTKAEHNDSQYAYLLFACLGCVTCVLLRAIGRLDRKLAVLGIRRDVDVSKGVGG